MTNNISGIGGTGPVGDQRAAKSPRADQRADSGGSAAKGGSDVTISSDASKIIDIQAKLKDLPEIDDARVERIRQQLADGQYHIDPRRLAAKFIELEGQL